MCVCVRTLRIKKSITDNHKLLYRASELTIQIFVFIVTPTTTQYIQYIKLAPSGEAEHFALYDYTIAHMTTLVDVAYTFLLVGYLFKFCRRSEISCLRQWVHAMAICSYIQHIVGAWRHSKYPIWQMGNRKDEKCTKNAFKKVKFCEINHLLAILYFYVRW